MVIVRCLFAIALSGGQKAGWRGFGELGRAEGGRRGWSRHLERVGGGSGIGVGVGLEAEGWGRLFVC